MTMKGSFVSVALSPYSLTILSVRLSVGLLFLSSEQLAVYSAGVYIMFL